MLPNKHILTIDDSETIRLLLRSLLTDQGARVDEASNGRTGLAQCAEQNYDLILLDLLLPDMNGIAVLQRIREKNDSSAVVMLTGSGGVKAATASLQQGADGYLEKQALTTSSDLAEFFYALEQALEHRAGLIAKKQLEQLKTDFYSMITHDLLNPAASLQVIHNMLLHDEVGPLTPQQIDLVEMGKESADTLVGLIRNYLDYAVIDSGHLRLDLSEVELRDVVQRSVKLATLQGSVKHQSLTFDAPSEPIPAQVDGERLKQVLDNLLSNAIKYTPAGGSISVQLRLEGGQAVIGIHDTGYGIPPAQHAALFTRYHRVRGEATRTARGTGLGLLIVKEIVAAHSGTIRVESEGVPGKGTTFTVSIPVQQAR